MKPAKPVRCAIYTRVSTDQGLEQDFNSLDAQYDASQAYIRSQAHADWTLLRAKYDDGGFSGGNTDRPAPALPCSAFSMTSRPARSMSSWSTRSIA
jgi:site-specific DNA recombinase